jgi:hypothetical protein
MISAVADLIFNLERDHGRWRGFHSQFAQGTMDLRVVCHSIIHRTRGAAQ